MNDVELNLSEEEAKALYRHLHQEAQGQEQFFQTYRQLQAYFFGRLTVEEVTELLEHA